MKKIILSAALLFSQPVFALLSPLHQSVAELKEITNSEKIFHLLPDSQKILSIDAVGRGYIVRTENYQMFIEVQYEKLTRPGPAKFTLKFNEPVKYRK